MANTLLAVIVGASTLLGKELIEELNKSDTEWDIRLTDAVDSGGHLVAGGDEPLVVQPLTPDVFDGRDVAFFAESAASTRAHWREAQMAKAAVVDLTGVLQDQQGALIRSPWIESPSISGGKTAGRGVDVIIPAHPAAVMLGLVGSRLTKAFGHVHLAATVLEPASQQGTRGMDELHQQTVSLLGFHSVPQEFYDAQVAFNLRIGLGEAAKVDLSKIAQTIRRDVRAVAGDAVASSIAMQLVQAPVFHGYTMSVFAELPAGAEMTAVRGALEGGVVELTESAEDVPSNQSVTQESGVSIAIREDAAPQGDARGYWLWMAADNLKLAARQAVACAEEIAALRASVKCSRRARS